MKSLIPSKRTLTKAGRDFLMIGLPTALLWIVGHPADLHQFGVSAETGAKIVGYATSGLFLYRLWRQMRGTEPTV